MVNKEDFVKRLEEILQYYGFSAASFADKINVQRSSISHLLSGRNKPSLEFVLKVVKSFPEVNLYWLLNGKGSFPSQQNTAEIAPQKTVTPSPLISETPKTTEKSIKKIVILYTDGSFEAYQEHS